MEQGYKKTLVCLAAAACLGAGLPALPVRAQEEDAEEPVVELTVEGDLYTLRAENATLGEVLDRLSEVTGVEAGVPEAVRAEPVDLALQQVSYEKLIGALAGSHALIYERDADGNYRLVSARVTSQEMLDGRVLTRRERRDVQRKVRVVRRATKELAGLYGDVRALEYKDAKELVDKRRRRFDELVNELAALGPGGARAMRDSYPEAETTRGKLALIEALGKIQDEEASLTLGALFEGDVPFSLQREMVAALGHRSDADTQQVLSRILAGEDDTRLRAATVMALSGQNGAVGNLALLIASEEETRDVRSEAVRSVGEIGGAEALSVLARAAAGAEDAAVRKSAIQELGRSFGEESLAALAGLLADPDEGIRNNVVKALGRVNSEGARELLAQAANTDASPAVRERAQRLLPAQGE